MSGLVRTLTSTSFAFVFRNLDNDFADVVRIPEQAKVPNVSAFKEVRVC